MQSRPSSSRPEISQIDWNFSDQSNEGLNSIHWYPATFIAAIPGSLVPLITQSGDTVLDPFCGTSTTGVESIRLGRKYIGIDANPIAVLISRAKLSFPDTEILTAILQDQPHTLFAGELPREGLAHPSEELLRRWYHDATYSELTLLLERIRSIGLPVERTVAQALFSSILKSVCSQGRHWGWVCDNVIPKAGEIQYKSAVDAFKRAVSDYIEGLNTMVHDMEVRGITTDRAELRARSRIVCDDTVAELLNLEESSIDAIVTSPPYYGVADYVKSQRLSFLWFHSKVLPVEGFATADFEPLRRREVGSRSYRHRMSSHQDYLSYMFQFFLAAKRVLKRGAPMALVFGESPTRRSTTPELENLASQAGFREIESVSRSIRENRRRMMGRVSKEYISVFSAE